MNRDYHDILAALVAQDAQFLVVGAHALAAHGYPRERAWPNRADIKGLEGRN